MAMDLVLISTSDAGVAGRSAALERMLASVSRAAAARPELSIVLLLLMQNAPAALSGAPGFPAFVEASAIPRRMSLSAARNALLSQARSRGLIGPQTVVGFPDDDCWYPPGTLEHVVRQFARAPELDLWFCRYSSAPVGADDVAAPPRPARAKEVIRQASSNTMFVRGRIVREGGSFDEALGVGTPTGGAEDTEFALRAHMLARQTVYLDAALVGHRDKNPQLRARYYRGGLVAIARYARRRDGVPAELVRKIAVGGWLTLRRELSPAAYIGALTAASRAAVRADRA